MSIGKKIGLAAFSLVASLIAITFVLILLTPFLSVKFDFVLMQSLIATSVGVFLAIWTAVFGSNIAKGNTLPKYMKVLPRTNFDELVYDQTKVEKSLAGQGYQPKPNNPRKKGNPPKKP